MVSMPNWPKKIIKHPDIKDLSRMRSLMNELGNPHLNLPKTVHIAGTNGKGSSCAMLKSILSAAGYRVHMYTSPHIIEFNERIVLAGHKIDDYFLLECLEKVRIASEKISLEPTFFEATTAAAFVAFSSIEADILILETGLGGRLDPTNIIEKPICSIITPISFDHMEFLGADIRLIAGEKAGIIKDNCPLIISRQDEAVMDILLSKAEEKNSPSIAYEYDYIPEKAENGFDYFSRLGDIKNIELGLLGDHQIINASAVISAIKLLNKFGFEIKDENIKNGLKSANWIGRIQKLKYKNFELFADGAHNISGAAALADWIKEQKFKNLKIIIGLTKNRDVSSILTQFKDLNAEIYSVSVLSEPMSYSDEKLSQIANDSGFKVKPLGTIANALDRIYWEEPKSNIVVTGSLFLISDLLKLN